MKFLFPFSLVSKNSNIVLYGASDVGYDFYRQIMSDGYVRLVAWLDKNYEMYRFLDIPVDPPEDIKNLTYDYVVVAVQRYNSFSSIRKYLMNLGVNESRIVWSSNPLVCYDIAKKYTMENRQADAKDAFETDPIELVDKDRLDIVVRYIYAKEILENTRDGIGKHLYEKMFDVMNQAVEPTDHFLFRYFSDYNEKKGIEAFEEAFIRLLESVRKQGFRREGFIPLNCRGRMINGSHRCAAALALGTKAWVRIYPIEGVAITDHYFGREWFIRAGFPEEKVNEIERVLCDVSMSHEQEVQNEITR